MFESKVDLFNEDIIQSMQEKEEGARVRGRGRERKQDRQAVTQDCLFLCMFALCLGSFRFHQIGIGIAKAESELGFCFVFTEMGGFPWGLKQRKHK